MRDSNYTVLFMKIRKIFSKTKEIVISTSHKDKVTARTVYCVCDSLDIYFITSKAYTKFKQISKNSNVALVINNIQIEGVADILGHPTSDENYFFKEICNREQDYMNYYIKYSRYKNSVLIRVKPSLITSYQGDGVYEYLDLREERAYIKGRKNNHIEGEIKNV